jgi:hypothetical protein
MSARRLLSCIALAALVLSATVVASPPGSTDPDQDNATEEDQPGQGPPEVGMPAPGADKAPAPQKAPGSEPPPLKTVGAIVAAIQPTVEELRGLRFDHAVSVEKADDAIARSHFEERMRTYWPEPQMRVEQDAYIDLGLLPGRSDLKGSVLEALKEQAAGYYDPQRNAFVVLDDMPGSMASIIVAHELTHALDDQHFGIDRLVDAAGGDSEKSGGVAAVVEGSGTLVMTMFTVREMVAGRLTAEGTKEIQESEAGQAKVLKTTPQVVQRILVGPYILGMRFLLRGDIASIPKDVAPKADLDRAFHDPPVSWEQVLHPEKYWDPVKRDLPRPIALPNLAPVLGEGWVLEGQGKLGELLLAILTGPEIDVLDPMGLKDARGWTNEAASGWGGDLWQHYRRGDGGVTVLATVWDSKKDAREFEAALPASPGRAVFAKADAVVVVAGAAGDHAKALAREALRAARASSGTPR